MDKHEADLEWFGPKRSNIWPITVEEAARRYPEAMVLFDFQCSHLAERSDVIFSINKKGRLSAEHSRRPSYESRTHWYPNMGVWVRYSTGVRYVSGRFTKVCAECRWEFSAYAFEKLRDEHGNWIGQERSRTCFACVRKLRAMAKQWQPMPKNWGSSLRNHSDEELVDLWQRH